MAKEAVKSLTMTFNSVTYKVREAPHDDHKSSDPVDVTCLDDTAMQYLPGALASSQEFEITVNGPSAVPTVNTVGDVTLTLSVETGSSTATSKTVTIAACILKEVAPANVSASGDRVKDYTLTFQPSGGAVTVSSGSNI